MAKKLKVPENLPHGVTTELPNVTYYRENIYQPYVRELLQQLDIRFEKHYRIICDLQLLIPVFFGKSMLIHAVP